MQEALNPPSSLEEVPFQPEPEPMIAEGPHLLAVDQGPPFYRNLHQGEDVNSFDGHCLVAGANMSLES